MICVETDQNPTFRNARKGLTPREKHRRNSDHRHCDRCSTIPGIAAICVASGKSILRSIFHIFPYPRWPFSSFTVRGVGSAGTRATRSSRMYLHMFLGHFAADVLRKRFNIEGEIIDSISRSTLFLSLPQRFCVQMD